MFNKSTLIFVCCCSFALAIAHPFFDLEEQQEQAQAYADYLAPHQYVYEQPQLELIRAVRSPEGGNLDLKYESSPDRGREASVRYNQDFLSSDDGRYSLGAYAQASRNFDYNRNDYGGGIMGSFRF